MPESPIVVAADGSAPAYAAVAWAAQTAQRHGASLHLVNSSTLPTLYGSAAAFTQSDFDLVHADGERIVEEATRVANEAAGADAKLDITGQVVTGPIIPALLEEAKTARLLVVGSRGLGKVGRALLGSVSAAVTTHAECPVAVIKDETAADAVNRTGPVVVGVDGSGNSRDAVVVAFAEADARGAEVVAVHAWSDASQFSLPNVEFPAVAEAEEALLSAALAGARQDHPDVAVRTVLVRDRPASNIVEQSAQAQLVVVGSHGRGGFTGMLLGSTSRAVLQNAECPVIVVRYRK